MSESDIGGDLPPLDPDLAAWFAADPAPTMPSAVWARLEGALAAEPPLRPPLGPPLGASPEVVDLSAERGRRRSRALPILAGAAGLVLVGAVVIPAMRGSDPAPVVADGAVMTTALAEPAQGASAPSAAAPEPTAALSGDVAATPGGTNAPLTTGVTALPRAMLETGTDYSADAMPSQVTTLLASAGLADSDDVSEAMTASPAVTDMPGTGLAATPEVLADCLGRLGLPAGSTPLLIDTATFDGQRAGVIVTVGAEADGQPRGLHVVAVGWECADADVAAARHWDLPLPVAP